eukprot:3387030-Pyramimonas_sp.AAC.1
MCSPRPPVTNSWLPGDRTATAPTLSHYRKLCTDFERARQGQATNDWSNAGRPGKAQDRGASSAR